MLIDPRSGTWLAVQEYLTAEIATLREKNDGFLSPEETLQVRAEIRAMKKLLDLPSQAGQLPQSRPEPFAYTT